MVLRASSFLQCGPRVARSLCKVLFEVLYNGRLSSKLYQGEMMYLQISCLFLAFLLSVSGFSSPPPGAIVVGPGGTYANLTAALADTSSSVRHDPRFSHLHVNIVDLGAGVFHQLWHL